MKAKELIEVLQKLNPEKEIVIQQGADYEYSGVAAVREIEMVNLESSDDDDVMDVIAIEFE